MNKKMLWHTLFWVGIITCDVLTGMPYWRSDSVKMLIVNYSLVLSLFYYTRFLTFRFMHASQAVSQQLPFVKYLLLSSIVVLFVGIRYVFDYFILIQGYTVTIWFYSFTQLKFALSFIIPAIGLAFAEKRKGIISRLNNEKDTLQMEKEQLSSEKWQLLREKTMLSKEVNKLRKQYRQALALNEEQADIHSELETEISNRQSLILVLNAELIATIEQYKLTVYEYMGKFDYYHRKLSRYRNLYGKLDDDED